MSRIAAHVAFPALTLLLLLAAGGCGDGAGATDGATDDDGTGCNLSDHLTCMEGCAAPMVIPQGGACVEGECRCDVCDDAACFAYCGMHFSGGRNTSSCVGSLCQCSHEDPAFDADAGRDGDAEGADADVVLDAEADAAIDGDAEVDDGEEADADAEADGGGLVECAGGWYDPTTGLCWQDPSGELPLIWDDAMTYCDGLSLGGHGSGSWHLPSIDELRSLIRGCPGTTTGGGCDVTDSCLDVSCWSDPCTGCSNFGGPGEGGCYWDAALAGECNSHWASSPYSGDDSFAWSVAFYGGYVHNYEKVFSGYVRCVRPGP